MICSFVLSALLFYGFFVVVSSYPNVEEAPNWPGWLLGFAGFFVLLVFEKQKTINKLIKEALTMVNEVVKFDAKKNVCFISDNDTLRTVVDTMMIFGFTEVVERDFTVLTKRNFGNMGKHLLLLLILGFMFVMPNVIYLNYSLKRPSKLTLKLISYNEIINSNK